MTCPNVNSSENDSTQLTKEEFNQNQAYRTLTGYPWLTLKCTTFDKRRFPKELFTNESRPECCRRVAARAVGAKRTAVDILPLVTGNAGCRQAGIRHIFPGMATVTSHACVSACQRKARVTTMVECNTLPAIRRMAAIAPGRKTTCMRIIFSMATYTCRFDVLIGPGFVARLTGNGGMQSNEWIFRQVVVKFHIHGPRGCFVAASTVFAQLCLVYVLRDMAVKTGH